jgi:hypothetical protein
VQYDYSRESKVREFVWKNTLCEAVGLKIRPTAAENYPPCLKAHITPKLSKEIAILWNTAGRGG